MAADMAAEAPVKKSRMMWALLAVIILVIAGVGVYFATRSAVPAEKVLVVGTTDDEITFDTADSYDYFSINLLQNTMAMLLTYVPGTTDLKPDLLTEVPTLANGGISANSLLYTLHIRSGAKFETGDAINATVVKYSIDRAVKLNGLPGFLLEPIKGATGYWNVSANPDGSWPPAKQSAWNNYTAQGIQKVDDLTVTIHLWRKWSPFPALLAFTITAPVNMKSFTDEKYYPNVIVSSGPYRMRNYIPHQRYELEANPNYFGTSPVVKRVTIVRYTTASNLKLAITTGAIDIAYRSILPQDFNDFKSNSNVRTMEGQSPYIRYLVFNTCSPAGVISLWCPRATPFQDVRLRRALAYATDRADINSTAYAGSVAPLYSLIPMGMFGHTEALRSVYGSAPNLAAAQALLTAAGYSAGSKFAFKLWYTPSHYGDPEIFVAQALKRAWEATGMITVTLDQTDWASYKAAYRTGGFDVFLLGWFPDYFDPDNYVFPFLHSSGTPSFGNWYKNVTMDGKIVDQAATSDPATRQADFTEIQSGLAWDAPYIPLFQGTQQVVFKPTVTGIVLDPIQFFRYFTINVT